MSLFLLLLSCFPLFLAPLRCFLSSIPPFIYYERLNGNIFKECLSVQISVNSELYIGKTEVFGKKLISILLGGGENRISKFNLQNGSRKQGS